MTTITPWRTTLRRLLGHLGELAPSLKRALWGLLVASVLQGLALACLFPFFSAALTGGDALAWLIAMCVFALMSGACKWWAQGFDYQGKGAAATHLLRTRLGEQLRRMPLERLADKRSGEINAALLGNVDEQILYVSMIADLILTALVVPLVVALAALAFDWRVGLLLLVLFPAIALLYRWRRPSFDHDMRAVAAADEQVSGDIGEYTQGLTVLRAARCEGERAKALQESLVHLERVQTVGHRRGSRPAVIVATVVELGLLVVTALGVTWAARGTLDIAVLAAVVIIVSRFFEPLSNFVSYTAIVALIETAFERVDALLAIPPHPTLAPATIPERFDVRFEGVTFRYTAEEKAVRPVLDELTATIAARSMTALVGPSGSGKTTLTRLLMRHADPEAGTITIGGVDVRSIPADALSGLVSVVFQDVYLFDDTVRANIRMARPDASDTEVEAAARSAQCLELIERLPEGWETRLGDIGGRLSGGERQRISIARALLKDAPIVILDEPTAALDTESERAVQRAIDALVRDKTVIVIAHRLSTVAGADQIWVLEDGRVVQTGRHEQLVRAGRYAAMWAAQERVKGWHVGSGRQDTREHPRGQAEIE